MQLCNASRTTHGSYFVISVGNSLSFAVAVVQVSYLGESCSTANRRRAKVLIIPLDAVVVLQHPTDPGHARRKKMLGLLPAKQKEAVRVIRPFMETLALFKNVMSSQLSPRRRSQVSSPGTPAGQR